MCVCVCPLLLCVGHMLFMVLDDDVGIVCDIDMIVDDGGNDDDDIDVCCRVDTVCVLLFAVVSCVCLEVDVVDAVIVVADVVIIVVVVAMCMIVFVVVGVF